jgi:hypothetical protein
VSDVTRLLNAVEQGDPKAAGELLPLVYEELRKLATIRMANEPAGQTLQATALVHEAWLRLAEPEAQVWNSRYHFFAAACFALLLAVSACVSTAQAIKNKSLFTAAEDARLKEMSAKQRETELRRIAEAERDRSQRFLYNANMNLAKRAWDEARVGRTVELLDLHRPQPGQPDLRNFEWFYLDHLCHRDLLTSH